MGLFSAIGNFIGGGKAKKAASQAAAAQTAAIQKGVDAVNAQNVWTQQQLGQFVAPGQQATSAIAQLLGLGATPAGAGDPSTVWRNYLEDNPDVAAQAAKEGVDPLVYAKHHYETFGPNEPWRQLRQPEAVDPATAAQQQAAAIQGLKDSPLFQSLFRTGEEAILQNAAATGGLRGGDTQRSLADFGSDTLARVIQQQLANLGGLSAQGANTALGGGQIGAGAANSIANLFGQKGTAEAQGILGKAAGSAAQTGAIFQGIGDLVGNFDLGKSGGGGGGIMSTIGKLLF